MRPRCRCAWCVSHLFERVFRFVARPFQPLLDADRVAVVRALVAVLAVTVFDAAVKARLPFADCVYVGTDLAGNIQTRHLSHAQYHGMFRVDLLDLLRLEQQIGRQMTLTLDQHYLWTNSLSLSRARTIA